MGLRPGAAGTYGGEIIARNLANGYTSCVVTASFAIDPSTRGKLPCDTPKDFMALDRVVAMPSELLIPPSMLTRYVKASIALAG